MCYQSIILALALVVGIIYLFLGNIRATIVPAVTLPVSLIGACLGLWIFGLTSFYTSCNNTKRSNRYR